MATSISKSPSLSSPFVRPRRLRVLERMAHRGVAFPGAVLAIRNQSEATVAMRLLTAGVLAVFACVSAGAEVERKTIGTLTCTLQSGGEGSATPVGQTRDISCSFQPTAGTAEERYMGTIRKLGSGNELSGKLVLVWTVSGTQTKDAPPGFLQQTYVGNEASPSASAAGSGVLVGEKDPSLALQQMTNDGTPPLSAAVTVIELRYATVRA